MTIRTKKTIESYYTLREKLLTEKRLFFTRFGDGEIISMMGRDHRSYKFSTALQKELFECISIDDPNFLIALPVNYKKERKMTVGVFSPYDFNDTMVDFLEKQKLVKEGHRYENIVVFHYLAVFKPKFIYTFFEEFIRPKRKMFIGSTPHQIAEKLYDTIHYYFQVPAKNAYQVVDEIWPDILKVIEDVELVIPSAGAASNVISKRLWYTKYTVQLLDIGSIIDAVEGKISRTWIRLQGHKINKILPKEYRERNAGKLFYYFLKDIKYFFRRLIK
ncbi:GT-D fold domain-containing glycosyltransferase [Bacteroidota bacterium]